MKSSRLIYNLSNLLSNSRRVLAAVALPFALLFSPWATAQTEPPAFSCALMSPTQTTNAAPAAAVYNNLLYFAFTGQAGDYIYIYTSSGGSSSGFPVSGPYAMLPAGSSATSGPALAVLGDTLYVAWDSSGILYYSTSTNGTTFTTPTEWPNATDFGANGSIMDAPSLTVWDGNLYVAVTDTAVNTFPPMVYVNEFNTLNIDTPNYQQGSIVYPVNAGPSLTVFNNQLWVAWTLQDDDNVILSNTSDPTLLTGFSYPQEGGQTLAGNPQLFVQNGTLYMAGRTNYPSNNLFIGGSTSGVFPFTWWERAETLTYSPAFTIYNGILYEAFRSNTGDQIFGCSS